MSSEHTTSRKGVTALIVAAWVVLVIYTAVVILFVGFGIAAKDSVESAFEFGYAVVLALPSASWSRFSTSARSTATGSGR